MTRLPPLALAAWALAATGTACQFLPCETEDPWLSTGPELRASGTVVARVPPAEECASSHGTAAPSAGNETETCCTWDLSDSVCGASGLGEFRPANGELPTWVGLDCRRVQLAFALPDLRRLEGGVHEYAVPLVAVVSLNERMPAPSVGGVVEPVALVGGELRLALELLERRGEPRRVTEEDGRVVTDDFLARARVAGAVGSGAAGGADEISFQLAIAQTAVDYGTMSDGCE